MYQNIGNFTLFENIKQAKEYISDFKLSSTQEDHFQRILDELNKKPNLVLPFTKMYFNNVSDDRFITYTEDFNELLRIIRWVKNNKELSKKLPKNLIDYYSIEELSDDIEKAEFNKQINKFNKSLYKEMRDNVERLSGSEKETYEYYAYKFMNLSKEERKTFTPLKYFQKNNLTIKDFINSLKNFIEGKSVNDRESAIRELAKEKNTEIVYDKNGVLVLVTSNQDQVCSLGSNRWCISYSPSFYNRYAGEDTLNTQFLVFNFNLPQSNKNSMFGVTIDLKDKVYSSGSSQNKDNKFVPLDQIVELTGVPRSIFVSKYKESVELVNDLVDKVQTGEIKVKKVSDFLELFNKFSEEKIIFAFIKKQKSEIKSIFYEIQKSKNTFGEFIKELIEIKMSGKNYDILNEILKFLPINPNINDIVTLIKKEISSEDIMFSLEDEDPLRDFIFASVLVNNSLFHFLDYNKDFFSKMPQIHITKALKSIESFISEKGFDKLIDLMKYFKKNYDKIFSDFFESTLLEGVNTGDDFSVEISFNQLKEVSNLFDINGTILINKFLSNLNKDEYAKVFLDGTFNDTFRFVRFNEETIELTQQSIINSSKTEFKKIIDSIRYIEQNTIYFRWSKILSHVDIFNRFVNEVLNFNNKTKIFENVKEVQHLFSVFDPNLVFRKISENNITDIDLFKIFILMYLNKARVEHSILMRSIDKKDVFIYVLNNKEDLLNEIKNIYKDSKLIKTKWSITESKIKDMIIFHMNYLTEKYIEEIDNFDSFEEQWEVLKKDDGSLEFDKIENLLFWLSLDEEKWKSENQEKFKEVFTETIEDIFDGDIDRFFDQDFSDFIQNYNADHIQILKNLGKILPKKYWENSNSSIILYCLYLNDSSYKYDFYSTIGLKIDEDWFYEMDIDELSQYFFNMSSITEYVDNFDIYIDFITEDLRLIEELTLENLKSCLDYCNISYSEDVFKNFDADEMKSYDKSSKIIVKNEKVLSLVDKLREFLSSDMLNEVVRALEYSFRMVEERISRNEFLETNLNQLDDILFPFEDGNYYNFQKERIKPDVEGLLENEMIFKEVINFNYLSMFETDDLLRSHIEVNGEYVLKDINYVTWSGKDYSLFNEIVKEEIPDSTDQLNEIIKYNTFKNLITENVNQKKLYQIVLVDDLSNLEKSIKKTWFTNKHQAIPPIDNFDNTLNPYILTIDQNIDENKIKNGKIDLEEIPNEIEVKHYNEKELGQIWNQKI